MALKGYMGRGLEQRGRDICSKGGRRGRGLPLKGGAPTGGPSSVAGGVWSVRARGRRGPFKAWPTWQLLEPPRHSEAGRRALPVEAAAGASAEDPPAEPAAAAAMGQNDLMGTAEDFADQVRPAPQPSGPYGPTDARLRRPAQLHGEIRGRLGGGLQGDSQGPRCCALSSALCTAAAPWGLLGMGIPSVHPAAHRRGPCCPSLLVWTLPWLPGLGPRHRRRGVYLSALLP